MERKRHAEDKTREHLLKKLKRLEKKIRKLPESDIEENVGNRSTRNNIPLEPVVRIITPEVEMFNQSPPEEDMETIQSVEDIDIFPVENEDMDRNEDKENKEEEIDGDILEILGVIEPQPKGEPLLKEIAERWCDFLKNGLKKEVKEEIAKDNPLFINMATIVPKLNPEVSAALNESAKKRDYIIESRQKQIATALSCLGSALQMTIKDGMMIGNKINIIKKLNDTCRLLCDSVHLDTKSRRSLVLMTINKEMKNSLQQTEAQEFLFGDDLVEKIKTARTVKKTGQDLKAPEIKKMNTPKTQLNSTYRNRSLNWRAPPRAAYRTQRPTAGGQAYYPVKTAKRDEKTSRRPLLRK